jgi:tetratricopeptide (TPR) repeat protein
MSRFPTTAEAKRLTSEGDRYLSAGNRSKAIQAYSEALKVEPSNVVYTFVQRGSALLENRLPNEAMRDFERAIALDPEYGPAYYGRAWAKGWKKDYRGELKDAQKGYQLNPGNSGIYLRRIGSAYTGLNRFNEAIEAYSKAIEINSRDEGTIYNRALCYIKMRQYDLALQDLDHALQLDPDWDWALFQKGLVHEYLGNFNEALNNYKKALLYNPHYGPALEGRVRVRGKFGRISPAKTGRNGNSQKVISGADVLFFVLFCLIISPIAIYLSISAIYNDNELHKRGLVTSAVVTNARIANGNGRTMYEIQYRYSSDGGITWHTCIDDLGRKNLWCPLTKTEWEIAQSTKRTPVKYLPDRPSINRLVYHDPPSSLFDYLGGLFLGISPWMIVLLLSYRKE